MVLALAMTLAGLNPEEFSGLIAKLTPDSKRRVVPGDDAGRPSSPSTRSDSSGVSSMAPSSVRSDGTWCHHGATPSSSRTPSVRSVEGSVSSLTPYSSRAPSVRSNDGSTPSRTPISSRPATPMEESLTNETVVETTLIDMPKLRRDILNLAANIREPGWQVIKPPLTHNDPFSYEGNKTVYNHPEEFNIKEDYPMRYCEKCGFGQPSPYLVWELTGKRASK